MRGNILLNSDFFMPSLLHNCSCVFDLRYIPYYMHIIIQTDTPIYQLPILLNNVLFHVHCMHLILGFNSFQVSHWKINHFFLGGGGYWGCRLNLFSGDLALAYLLQLTICLTTNLSPTWWKGIWLSLSFPLPSDFETKEGKEFSYRWLALDALETVKTVLLSPVQKYRSS